MESNGPKEMQNENYKAAQNNPKDTHTKPKHKIEKKSLNDHNQMQKSQDIHARMQHNHKELPINYR